MKIAIVDDMAKERSSLRECLLEWSAANDRKLDISEFQSGGDFLESCSVAVLDMVFMDIYMEEENGFQVVERLRTFTTSCVIVFVTSSREDALRAFPLHPFDYVVKPWRKETIFRVMTEAAALCRENDKDVAFTVGRQKRRMPVSEIAYAVSDNHHVRIVTVAGEQIKSFSTFAEVSEELLRDPRFLICNRGIIINMDFVDQCKGKCFVMKNGERLPLKVKDIPVLEETFAGYLFARTRRWSS